LALSACAVGPDFQRPPAPAERTYTREATVETSAPGGESQRFDVGREVPAAWWTALNSPALDALVSRALAQNPGLEAARATLRRNQDSLRAGYGVFLPQFDGRAGVTRERTSAAPGLLPSNTFNLFTLSGTVSYALDLWGGERRQVEALQADVDAQRYTVAGAVIMLAGNVVDAAVAKAAYRDEIDATKVTLALLGEQDRIAKAQATAGTEPYSNVLSLESQMASTAASIPPLEEKIDQASHLLAALSGLSPAAFDGETPRLEELHLPRDVPLTLPATLVRQRPDILVAEAELHAANAAIGVATAAMLPNLTLSGSLGVGSTSLSELANPASTLWSLGAGLTQPLFHGGTLYFEQRAAVDARDAAAAQYRQTVLAAFEQVADALRALAHDADAVAAQASAVDTAEHALRLLQANYEAGIATYLQVLVADSQYLQAKTGYVEAVAQRLQDTVALCVALGGGWSRSADAPAAR
jgi:NodT family efflux transporter outer membrane factor (OMF) lipoprotein